MSYRSCARALLCCLPLGALLVGLASPAPAANKKKEEAANRLVQQALQQEIYGTEGNRAKLLEAACQQAKDYPPAMWHQGKVQINRKWVSIDRVPQLTQQNHLFQQYRKLRAETPDSVAGQFQLAQWCASKKLFDEARAHLTKVLELSPDHPQARALLGHRLVGGVWMTPQEIADAQADLKAQADAFKQWGPKLEVIRDGLADDSRFRQEKAREQLAEINDPAAIPALETLLANASEEAALAVVNVLRDMKGHAAAEALARQAVLSPWEMVREQASRRLKKRPRDTYVPLLLSSMYTPVQIRAELYRTPRGRLLYRHLFYREGQKEKQLAVFETEYRRRALPGGDGDITLGIALGHIQQTAEGRQQAALRQNAVTKEVNTRCAYTLATATGETYESDPNWWWQWWSDENEVFQAKAERQFTRQDHITITDPVSSGGGASGDGSSGGHSSPPPPMYDCLAAGTKVWTLHGPTAIEEIQVGDRVLSQDPDTGELAYKPVLRTTIRPAGPVFDVKVGYDSLTTSGGHLFWVAGQGWVKARELEPESKLHQVTATAAVRTVEETEFVKTYNIVVADFHTYFVGQGQVLCHDNTIKATTDAVVPGLAAK